MHIFFMCLFSANSTISGKRHHRLHDQFYALFICIVILCFCFQSRWSSFCLRWFFTRSLVAAFFFSFLMTDAHAAPCEDPYRDGEAWRHPPVPPPRPGAWPASGEVVEQHTWPEAGAATASAASDRGGAGVTASACVRTPVFSKASMCIDAL
jgi:hypothetical protein